MHEFRISVTFPTFYLPVIQDVDGNCISIGTFYDLTCRYRYLYNLGGPIGNS